jgi:hypothetical protein
MKKIYLFLFTALGFSAAALAQPTLTSANFAYAVSDNQLYYVADTNSLVDPTTGANVVFSYTGLRGYGLTQNQFIINPATTTYGTTFPTADYADTSNAVSTNTRYSEIIGTDSIINLGFVANVPTYGDIIAEYSYNPEVLMTFPFNYSNNFTDIYSGTFTVQGQSTDGNGTVTVDADSWGQLQLPTITIDSVLRVRSVEYVITDTLVIPFPPITILPVEINAEYINYYKPSLSKFPILSYIAGTITQEGTTLDSTQRFVSQYPLFGVNVNEITNNLVNLNIYPNPTNKNNTILTLELEKNSAVKIELMNKLGQHIRTVYNDQVSQGINNINVNTINLASGIYFVNTYINGIGVTKKLVVQ